MFVNKVIAEYARTSSRFRLVFVAKALMSEIMEMIENE